MFQVPYWMIPFGAVIWLSYRHIGSPNVSAQSKQIIFGLALASFVLPTFWPLLSIPSQLLQVGICVYLLQSDALKNWQRRSHQAMAQPGPSRRDPPARRTPC